MPVVAPSLLAADFSDLKSEIKMINNSAADWLHIDVMDGVFVPNISFGFPILSSIKNIIEKPLDVHLMIVNPSKYLGSFIEAGAQMLTFHWEAEVHHHRCIQEIKSKKCKAGIVLNPSTNVQVLEDVLEDLDMVLIMSVNPGFGGQKFIENTYRKVGRLKEMILKKNLKTLIEIDGGVNLENGQKLVESGADVLVAGSSVFNSQNPVETISDFKSL
jgi:ribulose-phosphate 3-epimerase